MKNVPRPIRVIVTRNVYFRPTMSPMRPNSSAPERPHGKPGGECQQSENEAHIGRNVGKAVLSQEYAEHPVDVEVVPFEHRAERRRWIEASQARVVEHPADVCGCE
jgi:hypothetical protein